MKRAIKKLLGDLFASKRFRVMLATVLGWVAAKAGWDIDVDTYVPILVAAGGYIVGQSVSDIGKGAKEKSIAIGRSALEAGKAAGAKALLSVIEEHVPAELKIVAMEKSMRRLGEEAEKGLRWVESYDFDRPLPDNFHARTPEWMAAHRGE